MPISHVHRTIFVHIPKTAGTSVESVLGMHGDKADIGIRPYFNQEVDREHLYGQDLQHMTAADLKHVLQHQGVFDRYFKFSIVRNPWDRLVSVFAWMNQKWAKGMELTEAEFEASLRQLHGMFIIARSTKQPLRVGPHLWPQAHFLVDRERKQLVDFVARHENLTTDWEHIRRKIGIEADLPLRMKSHHRPYQSYYNATTRAMVEEIYAEDIAAFSYAF
ncbi:MAG: sulfotransferase family 2 domain-containing protein [Steroidobacteraceae bacterium]